MENTGLELVRLDALGLPKIRPWWEVINSKVSKVKIGTKQSNIRAKHQHKLTKNPNCETFKWIRVSVFGCLSE